MESFISQYILNHSPENMIAVSCAIVLDAECYYRYNYENAEEKMSLVLSEALVKTFGINYPSRHCGQEFHKNFHEIVCDGMDAITIKEMLQRISHRNIDLAASNHGLTRIQEC